jgi:hypothetical protein
MKQTINFSQFTDAFNGPEGSDRSNQFSYEGKKALFDYLEEYEDSTGEEVELDVIALCCEYTEYSCIKDFHSDYEEDEYPSVEAIEQATTVIPVGNGFIIQQF